MVEEIKDHLREKIIPFWKSMHDERGGFYGYMDFDLKVDKEAEKGCILNSRILWFFSSAYKVLKDEPLLIEARHAYEFMNRFCFDRDYGGVFWSTDAEGKPLDTTKHTYNQAFAIYGLCAYYDATSDEDAILAAKNLFEIIEESMRDEGGYLEAFSRDYTPVSNEKLSENGVEAKRSMNTILHVMEAYTELYRLTKDQIVAGKIREILDIISEKLYNKDLKRQEVFFDLEYNSLINLWSFGHDIEAAWLINRATAVLGDDEYTAKMDKITEALADNVYRYAFDGHSIPVEEENGVIKQDRVWWVQAEGINGFIDAYQKDPERKEYLNAAEELWDYIKKYLVDKRKNSEWFWYVNPDGSAAKEPIVEPWKCPYHNGRMCLEVITRNVT
ncbi:MAG: AGE family epimerase/isomerase [Lachnospiraceae bacterium]|nr:AGE family epimerase/isomerase [Lachnospiraceae bacterium]